jgi:DNA-binding XRE family transcriptional regulator
MTFYAFSKIIKQKRIEFWYKQKEMANKIPTQIVRYNRIENGSLEPSFIELQAICRILKLDLTEILELKKPIEDTIVIFD